ncbi:ATP synthase subunit beta [Methylobacterium sp. Leaf399]|uniref:class I SAM-dependent methyltransferase n=1 Tax=Methylobacterium sp. Leaf399 TaxID=1736364 RepID=UPI0006F845BD|nr:SAM-dependent methyltransferase [Methylobacterium sp. Leaf399]KQT07321.1 ATP synthase subunit beta [Methylobacterium sp. Leaf399]
MTTPLLAELRDEIAAAGPIGLDRYMALCLSHPVHGYYRTRDPLGARGDFVTAPEISQMFGELIGLWIASVGAMMAATAPLAIVELGPGRGTLMADALRALRRVAPDAAVDLHLVETSPTLRAIQATCLHAHAPTWHESVETLPEGPAIVVANEFFDALPVRQFQRTERGWCERLVGLDAAGTGLAFGLAAEPDPRLTAAAPVGVVLTLPGAALDVVRHLSAARVRGGGAVLVIDYGHARPSFGDSFQAVSGHRFVDPLRDPGEADLTTHVDFAALAAAAAGEGAAVHAAIDQRDFLFALGLRARADRLKLRATPAQAEAIEAAVMRLTEAGRTGMGRLFKAMAFGHPALGPLPGFPSPPDSAQP